MTGCAATPRASLPSNSRAVCAIVRALAMIMAVMDVGEALVIAHDRRRRQVRGAAPASPMLPECLGPIVANGPWRAGSHLVAVSPRYGQLSQSKQQAARLRDLVTVTPSDCLF